MTRVIMSLSARYSEGNQRGLKTWQWCCLKQYFPPPSLNIRTQMINSIKLSSKISIGQNWSRIHLKALKYFANNADDLDFGITCYSVASLLRLCSAAAESCLLYDCTWRHKGSVAYSDDGKRHINTCTRHTHTKLLCLWLKLSCVRKHAFTLAEDISVTSNI